MARKQESEPSVPEAARPAYDAIINLTDTFCQAYLTWVSGDMPMRKALAFG